MKKWLKGDNAIVAPRDVHQTAQTIKKYTKITRKMA